ncbi:hypothetical protein Chor_011131 [Crotalus horridus]
MQVTAVLILVLLCTSSKGHRSPLNDFQRLKATQLITSIQQRVEQFCVVEECARQCNTLLDCRAFHYNWQRSECQLLTVTQISPHTQLQRNVHFDLYQKKNIIHPNIMVWKKIIAGIQIMIGMAPGATQLILLPDIKAVVSRNVKMVNKLT